MNEQRNAEIAKTLGIVDDLPRVEVNHLFRARLLQRIESMENSKLAAGSRGVAFSPRLAFFGLLLVLNIASAMLLFTHDSPLTTTGVSGGIAELFSDDEGGGPALSYYDDQSAIGR